MPSMSSAPASMPAITVRAFAVRFGDGSVSCSSSRLASPAASAKRMTEATPAADTRFGSSKTGVRAGA